MCQVRRNQHCVVATHLVLLAPGGWEVSKHGASRVGEFTAWRLGEHLDTGHVFLQVKRTGEDIAGR